MKMYIYARRTAVKKRLRLRKVRAIRALLLPPVVIIFALYLAATALGIEYSPIVHVGMGINISFMAALIGLEDDEK